MVVHGTAFPWGCQFCKIRKFVLLITRPSLVLSKCVLSSWEFARQNEDRRGEMEGGREGGERTWKKGRRKMRNLWDHSVCSNPRLLFCLQERTAGPSRIKNISVAAWASVPTVAPMSFKTKWELQRRVIPSNLWEGHTYHKKGRRNTVILWCFTP